MQLDFSVNFSVTLWIRPQDTPFAPPTPSLLLRSAQCSINTTKTNTNQSFPLLIRVFLFLESAPEVLAPLLKRVVKHVKAYFNTGNLNTAELNQKLTSSN